MKLQKIIAIALLSTLFMGMPALAKTTGAAKKAAASVAHKQAKTKTGAKKVTKTTRKTSASKSTAKATFSVSIAASVKSASGVKPPRGYMEALLKAEKDCVAARTLAQKRACDEEERAAAAMVNTSGAASAAAPVDNVSAGSDQE